MLSFRVAYFEQHVTKANVASIISKIVNYKFIELAEVPQKPKSSSSKALSSRRQLRSSSQKNQPKISSFLAPSKSLSTDSTICQSNIVSILHNKSRCVVEDFMKLPNGTEIAVLVPTLSSKQPQSVCSIMSSLKDYNVVQFGQKCSTKYHLLHATIKSNNYLANLESEVTTLSEVMSAFNLNRNNGYGLSVSLHIDRKKLMV